MPILTSVILAPVFHEYRTRYPQVKIELIEDNSMGIRRAVEEHQADFAILSSPFGELDSEILFHDRMIAACNASAGKTSILDLNEKPERFIFCKAGHETTMEILRAHNVNISGSFIVEQPETAVKLAENGNGIAVLSDFVLDNIPNNLVRIPLTPEINMDIGLAANDLHGLTPVAEELRRMISEFTPGIHSKPV